MVLPEAIYGALHQDSRSLAISAISSYTELGLLEGQAGGSPRERLVHLYHAHVEPFLARSKARADAAWRRSLDAARAHMPGASQHVVEIGAATDFVREVFAQVAERRFEPSELHAHATLAFVIVVGRAVRSAPWSQAVAQADAAAADADLEGRHDAQP